MTMPSETTAELLVHRMTREAEDVLSLELIRPDGGPLPPWEPGAHLDLHLGGGPVRQYSLCGDPLDTGRYRLGVLRGPASRGGSAHVHTTLRPGATVRVTGPRNRFPLVEADRYLFIAGGIGITPLLAMARQAARLGVPWTMVYGGRSRASMAFTDELAELSGLAGPGEVTLVPQDEQGLIDLDGLLGATAGGTAVYCCGPEPLIAAVEARCPAHTERFAAPDTAEPARAGTAFEVECRRSARTVLVEPGRSVLDAVEEAGITVLSSCRDGICGTCETPVLEGVPDHRDFLLSDDERAAGGSMMICVSRARTDRLVLDL